MGKRGALRLGRRGCLGFSEGKKQYLVESFSADASMNEREFVFFILGAGVACLVVALALLGSPL